MCIGHLGHIRNAYTTSVSKPARYNHWDYPDVNRRVILNWILNRV
jgi:hypothetical protein